MKIFDFFIVKLTICLIVGIGVGAFYKFSLQTSLIISTFLLVLLFINYLVFRHSFKRSIWFGIITYATIVSLGITTKNLHNEQNFKNHYTNTFQLDNSEVHLLQLTIKEALKSNNSYYRYYADVSTIDATQVLGKLLLNIKKDSLFPQLQTDTQILVQGGLQELYPPLNPYQFNYKSYLNRHDIYAQVYTESNSIYIESTKAHSLYGYANIIRQTIISRLNNYDFKPNELAIIKALLLGQRQDISDELRQQYINAGAIHILAISGLHIGIILMILNFLFGFLNRFKNGRLIKTILILILLWSFAVVAGLSPSVMRAVTMFSAVAIGMNLKRPHNIYNTLAISAFVILLFKPMFLFEIGFQLSYLAVIGIVAIQPLLYNRIKTKYWLPNKVGELLTVSIAAQIGVFPLSLYYFHQFPGLFFLSNLIIIPILGVVLGFGFFIILLALCNSPNNFIFETYGTLISLMNDFFNWVSLQEAFIFKDIPFTLVMVIGSYLLIVSTIRLLVRFNYKNILVSLSSVIVLQGIWFYTNYSTKQGNELVVFHKSRYSIIGEKHGEFLKLAHNLDSATKHSDYIIKNYTIGNLIKEVNQDTLQNIYSFKKKTLLVIDSLPVFQHISFKPDYIVLRQSPKINLNRLIDSTNITTVIADGSNYKTYVNRWRQTCEKRKIPFHYTGEKGAFILK